MGDYAPYFENVLEASPFGAVVLLDMQEKFVSRLLHSWKKSL